VTRWWLGELAWPQLVRQPHVTVHGGRTIRQQMSQWFLGYALTPANRSWLGHTLQLVQSESAD
jgi:hypothetical protein